MRFVGHGAVTVDNTGSASVSLPEGLAAGNVMFLHVTQTTAHSAVATPSGWTLVGRVQLSTTFVALLFYRVYVAGDGAPTVTIGGTQTSVISAYADNDPAMGNPKLTGTYSTATGLTALSYVAVAATEPDPADRLITFVSTDSVAAIGDSDIDLSVTGQYTAYGAPAIQSTFSAWVDLPLSSARTLTADLNPFGGGPINFIAFTLTIPPKDRSVTPALGSLEEAYRQPPLLGAGALLGPVADGNPRIVFQVLNPAPGDALYWDKAHWDDGPWAGPGRWQEVTGRVRGVTWQRGTSNPLSKPEVGTANVTLENLDGFASPWATSGPFTDGYIPPTNPGTNPPGAPRHLAGLGGDTEVDLTWNAPASDGGSPVTGYNVYVGTTTGGESTTPTNGSPITSLAYSVSGLTDGTTYYFVVTALNANGEGPPSAEVSVTPMVPGSGYGSGPYGSGPYGG